MTLAILYEDDWLAVLNKPANFLSVPGRGEDKLDSIVHRAALEFGEAHVVHRLDWATSGLMLVAKTLECQRRMYALFRSREVSKRYHALLQGNVLGEWGYVRKPLICDWPNRPRQKICRFHGKDALTKWKLMGYEGNQSRVELEPITGRSHQLRVHMQSLGHAIVGDEFYDPLTTEANPRLCLHAYSIEFHHPFTSALVKFISPTPF